MPFFEDEGPAVCRHGTPFETLCSECDAEDGDSGDEGDDA